MTPATTSSAEARSYQWYADGQWRDAPSSFDDACACVRSGDRHRSPPSRAGNGMSAARA